MAGRWIWISARQRHCRATGDLPRCHGEDLANDQIANDVPVTVNSSLLLGPGTLNLNTYSDTTGSLSGNGIVQLGGGTLITGGDDPSTTFSGEIDPKIANDTGALAKVGFGTFTLTGTNDFIGTTLVDDGALLVNGVQEFSPLTVNAGAVLGDIGTVGPITSDGGTVSPGNGQPGVLTAVHALVLNPGSTFAARITPEGYDTLDVTAPPPSLPPGVVLPLSQVNLGLGTSFLDLSPSYSPPPGLELHADQQHHWNAGPGLFRGPARGHRLHGRRHQLPDHVQGGLERGQRGADRARCPRRAYPVGLQCVARQRQGCGAHQWGGRGSPCRSRTSMATMWTNRA